MSAPQRGEIYDLGYRKYDGPRLGRAYAVRSLFSLSLRNVFGLGRTKTSKFLAFGLAIIAFIPALVQLIAAAVGAGDFEILEAHSYYNEVQIVLVLFVAMIGSDLVGNDRRTQTLVLYFSRPLDRDDYALTKIASLWAGLMLITLVPQLIAFVGNWLGASDSSGWLSDNIADLPRIVITAILVCALFASYGVLLASFSTRRAFSTIGVLAFFLILLTVASIVIAVSNVATARVVVLINPIHVLTGATLTIFDAVEKIPDVFGQFDDGIADFREGDPPQQIAYADLPGFSYIAAMCVHIGLAASLTIRRYRGIR